MNQLINYCFFTTLFLILIGIVNISFSQRKEYVFAKASGISPILRKKKDRQQSKETNSNTTQQLTVVTALEDLTALDLEEDVNVVENFTWHEGKCLAYENYFGWVENCESPVPAKVKLQADISECFNKVWLSDSIVLDSKYLFAHAYFNIWDSKSVDPYHYDKKFTESDSVTFKLYDEKQGSVWSAPIYKTVRNSEFGFRKYRWHHGIDLDLEIGDSVYAAFDGVVRIAKYNRGGYGWYVLLRHENGLETLYGHLTRFLVKPGQEVKAGELIGLGGNTGRSTGPHLHFEVRYQGQAFNPESMYDFDNDSLKTQYFTLTQKHYQDQQSRSKAQFHKVRSGDTLGKLASMYGIPIATLCRLNGITKKTILRPGRNLRVR